MPSALPKSTMSLDELTICEDFLDTNREYAISLWSNIEKIRQWHGTDGCSETREGRTCVDCELCSADGLLGAAQKALVSFNDTENRLQEVRVSLGKCISSRRQGPNRETLIRSNLAKATFLSIVTVGDTLRSQHATWKARLQSELATLPSSVQISQDISTDLSGLDQSKDGDISFPTYSDPSFVGPEANLKLSTAPTGWVPETTSSSNNSMVVIFRRCLSSDCPCEANRARTASNTNLGDPCGSQVASNVPPLSLNSKKKRTSRVTAKPETAARGNGDHATRSTTTNLERHLKGTSDTSDTLAKKKTNAQIQKPNATYYDLSGTDARALDAQRPQDVISVGEHAPSGLRSETASLTQETDLSSATLELIVDPRVFRLREQIARSDDARRVLIEWCRAWVADRQLATRERHGTGSGASRGHGSTRDARGHPFALAHGPETVISGKPLWMTSQVGEAAKNSLFHDDDETTMAEDERSNSEQKELKKGWLLAQKKRYKNRKRC